MLPAQTKFHNETSSPQKEIVMAYMILVVTQIWFLTYTLAFVHRAEIYEIFV